MERSSAPSPLRPRNAQRRLRALRPVRLVPVSAVVLALCVPTGGQAGIRRATNIAAILAYPNFYHLQPVLLVGTVAQEPNGEVHVSDGTSSLRVILDGRAPDGLNEVRGVFWDLGRMKPDDPRLAGYDLKRTFNIHPESAWPHPGNVMAIIASGARAITPTKPESGIAATAGSTRPPDFPTAPIRSIVLDASRYVDQQVTITGQFYGRNLTGDLPDAPGQSRYDFVLRAADASIWVTKTRPSGKDARGNTFRLGLDARIDTGKWLKVSGTVRQGRGLLWVDAEAGVLALVEAPENTAIAEETPVRVPAAPPVEVIFSAPTEDETDVPLAMNIRIQFSRDMDPATFRGRVRVGYLDARGAMPVAILPADFTTQYRPANRVLEVKFAKRLERFRRMKVELTEGILGTDQQPLKPWTLVFLLGGS